MSRKKAPDDKVGNSTAKAVEVMPANVEWVTPTPPVSLESRDLWDAVWDLGGRGCACVDAVGSFVEGHHAVS